VRAYADGKVERLPALAEDLVRQRVDVIVAFGEAPALAAAALGLTVPPSVLLRANRVIE